MVIFSVIIDLGMLAQACMSEYLLSIANEELVCDTPETKIYVYVLSGLTLVRVYHLIIMFFFCLFCLPCYMCSDSCFIKKWLITEGAPSYIIANLQNTWTWPYAEDQRDNKPKIQNNTGDSAIKSSDIQVSKIPTNCPICFF